MELDDAGTLGGSERSSPPERTEERLLRHLEHQRLLVQKLLAGVQASGVDAMMARVMPNYLVNGPASKPDARHLE